MYKRPKDRYGFEDTRYPENWNNLRFYIFKRDHYTCQICGRKSDLVCHHIKPKGYGGSDHPNNLVTLCKRCHRKIHKIKD